MPHAARLCCGCRSARRSLGLEVAGRHPVSGGPAEPLPIEGTTPVTGAAPTHLLRIEES